MSSYTLTETTIFNAETAAISTQVGLDLRSEDKKVPVTLIAAGLAGSETVSIWFSIDGGTTYEAYMVDGSQLTLSANNNVRACYSGLYLGFTKSSSVSPVTVIANIMSR